MQARHVINHLVALIVFVNYSLMVQQASRSTDLNLSIFVRHVMLRHDGTTVIKRQLLGSSL